MPTKRPKENTSAKVSPCRAIHWPRPARGGRRLVRTGANACCLSMLFPRFLWLMISGALLYNFSMQTSIGFRRILPLAGYFFKRHRSMTAIHERSSVIIEEIIINTILSFEKMVELRGQVWYNDLDFSEKEGMYHV